jgi:large subunit ribosomal protein L15
MPPRLNLETFNVATVAPRALTTAFLLPFLQQQTRSASIISSLSDVPSAYNKRIRRGRGPSSGKGKTSGRGHKGQKQHGKVPYGFQGGQTVEEVVKGKGGDAHMSVCLFIPFSESITGQYLTPQTPASPPNSPP